MRNDIVSHTRTWWPKLMKLEKLLEILLKGIILHSEFKSATQIYVNPIHFEIQLILRNVLVPHTWWPKSMKSEKISKMFHRVNFAFWIQICNLNFCKSHTFWNTANIEKEPCFSYEDLMTKIDEIRKIARNSFIG